MPGISKQELNNYKKYLELKKEEDRLVDKIRKTGGTNYDVKQIQRVRKELKPLTAEYKKLNDQIEDVNKSTAKAAKAAGDLGKTTGDLQLDKVFRGLSGEILKTGKTLDTMGKQWSKSMMKGDKQMSSVIKGVIDSTNDIAKSMKDKTTFMTKDLDIALAQAQTQMDIVKNTKNVSQEVQNQAKSSQHPQQLMLAVSLQTQSN